MIIYDNKKFKKFITNKETRNIIDDIHRQCVAFDSSIISDKKTTKQAAMLIVNA